jgi:hypothetical protein
MRQGEKLRRPLDDDAGPDAAGIETKQPSIGPTRRLEQNLRDKMRLTQGAGL